jgi:hypothetical protein
MRDFSTGRHPFTHVWKPTKLKIEREAAWALLFDQPFTKWGWALIQPFFTAVTQDRQLTGKEAAAP